MCLANLSLVIARDDGVAPSSRYKCSPPILWFVAPVSNLAPILSLLLCSLLGVSAQLTLNEQPLKHVLQLSRETAIFHANLPVLTPQSRLFTLSDAQTGSLPHFMLDLERVPVIILLLNFDM